MGKIGIYQKLIVLLFGFALALQTFRNDLVLIDYAVNTDKYAALCENKASPEMECNGHCQMVKKMESADEQTNNFPQLKIKMSDITLYLEESLSLSFRIFKADKIQYGEFPESEIVGVDDALFRPPIMNDFI